MADGKSAPVDIIKPTPAPDTATIAPQKTCHRFFAPVVIPEPDKLDPRRATIQPRLGNFPCIKEQCTLWNAEKEECWDVSARRGQALMGEYAFGKLNDVSIGAGE